MSAFFAGAVSPCNHNPCMNGGTCRGSGADDFECDCSDGYQGVRCETRMSLTAQLLYTFIAMTGHFR